MCYHCFDVVIQELQRTNKHLTKSTPSTSSTASISTLSSAPTFWETLPHQDVECPLFVTWEKRTKPPSATSLFKRHARSDNNSSNKSLDDSTSKHDYALRGCIGTLSPKPLKSALTEYALLSAMHDRRFPPLTWQEVPHVRVAVSLLVKYETCKDWSDWTVGIHGIVLKWRWDTRDYSATYLPEVASDQGWDVATTVDSLIRKAGFRGRITAEVKEALQCTRYQTSKIKVTFEDYVQATGMDLSSLVSVNAYGSPHWIIDEHGHGHTNSDGSSNCAVS
jgi:AMME syndrome candidate gene 1 protein